MFKNFQQPQLVVLTLALWQFRYLGVVSRYLGQLPFAAVTPGCPGYPSSACQGRRPLVRDLVILRTALGCPASHLPWVQGSVAILIVSFTIAC